MIQNVKKVIKLLVILILIIFFIKLFFLKSFSKNKINEDILFLKLFGNEKLSSNQNDSSIYNKQYKFNIRYKNLDFKSIDLSDTIDRKTLIYEKIAPGTSGNFNILLESNQDLKYKIVFNSITEKPQNLNFRALKGNEIIGTEKTLEELSEKLTGFINKNEKINITINWYWNYENDEKNTDLQDTKDAENIRKYQFEIYTIGEE